VGTVWVARDMERGDMQYAVFSRKPNRSVRGFQPGDKDCIRVDVRNEIGVELAGRVLAVSECIEIVSSEVV